MLLLDIMVVDTQGPPLDSEVGQSKGKGKAVPQGVCLITCYCCSKTWPWWFVGLGSKRVRGEELDLPPLPPKKTPKVSAPRPKKTKDVTLRGPGTKWWLACMISVELCVNNCKCNDCVSCVQIEGVLISLKLILLIEVWWDLVTKEVDRLGLSVWDTVVVTHIAPLREGVLLKWLDEMETQLLS